MTAADDKTWWLLGDRHNGAHVAEAPDRVKAKTVARTTLALSFEAASYGRTRAAETASNYGVYVIAGGLTREEALRAQAEWAAYRTGFAEELRARYRKTLSQRTR